MTVRHPKNARRLVMAAVGAACAATLVACGPTSYEIPIETPIQPKLDVSSFQRVLIAGFVSGGTEDVDGNQETVRLLRSQLRTKSSLRVIDADVMQLQEIAQEQNKAASEPSASADAPPADRESSAPPPAPAPAAASASGQPLPLPQRIREEKDLEPYERLFANTTYWKRIGEEYQNPLIVTGTVLFMPNTRSGFVNRDVEQGWIRIEAAATALPSAHLYGATRASSSSRSSSSSTAGRARPSIPRRTAKKCSTRRSRTCRR